MFEQRRRLILVILMAMVWGPPALDSLFAQGDTDPSAAVFDETVVNTFRLTIAPSDWEAIVERPRDNTWRHADLVWASAVGTVTLRDIGVRASGESSRIPGNQKPSLRLQIDQFVPGQELRDLSNLKLDASFEDPAMMRNPLAYAVYRARGIEAPRYAYARLYINGEYKGLYGVEERVDEDFVRHHFGEPIHQLYAADDLIWAWEADDPSDPSNYVPDPFVPRIRRLPDDAEAVRDLIRVVNFEPSAANQVFDVDWFLEFMAVEVIIGETDRFISSYDPPEHKEIISQNFFIYKRGRQFVTIPWDADQSYTRSPDARITLGFDLRVATRRLILENPANREAFRTKLRQMLQGFHSTAAVRQRIDAIFALISEHVLEENPGGFQDFVQEVNDLKDYVPARNASVQRQIE